MNYVEKVWDTFIRAMKGDLQAQAEILYVDAMLNGDNRLIKEEKKMLNIDKYREEVEKRMGWAVREDPKNPKPVHLILKEIAFGERLPYMDGDELVDWLFEEYEPPLLKNGDGLKPGDWIMVRDNDKDDWEKKVFIGYLKGYFYCASELFGALEADAASYSQARLPEDGE